MEFVASDQNPLVKLARKLSRSAHERRKAGKTLLDGAHLIAAYAARFGLEGAQLLVSEPARQVAEIEALVGAGRAGRVVVVPAALFRGISPVETPSGIAAVIDIPDRIPKRVAGESWIVLDGIQDPGNLGSILRTAAATGISRAVLSKTCSDVWSPKCLRGGMGAQFVLPCEQADLLAALADFPGRCVATAPEQGRPLPEADLAGDTALLFGAEGSGLGAALFARADAVVHVPLSSGVESLNVAAAVAMCCYERLRQSRTHVR